LEDRTAHLSIFAFPRRPATPDLGGTAHYAPSCLGPGADLVCLPEDHDRLRTSLAKSFALASTDDLEAWRIGSGRPRMGVDVFEGDLPQEAGLMQAVALDKARFLGKEALAAVDGSTPLRTIVLAVETSEPVSPGEELLAGGQHAGTITSVTGHDDGVVGLARLWGEVRSGPFATPQGVALTVRSPA